MTTRTSGARQAIPTDVADRATADFAPTEAVRIGAEVEWLVYDRNDITRPVTAPETAATATGPLPASGAITIEPGGQLELVTHPAKNAADLIEAIDLDTQVLVERFAADGLLLVPVGLDPIRRASRTLDRPRYRAMERYFARVSPAGLQMMSRTASLQLSIDFGPDPAATWRRASTVAPVLAAVFANSPTTFGSEFSPVSHRQQIWMQTDPSRTRPVGPVPADWPRYILDAQVMLRHDAASIIEVDPTGSSFAEWLASSQPPSVDELNLHLTSLFPPLRPRGFLELRMIDALPRLGRMAAIATVWTLLTDPIVGANAERLCAALADPWEVAIRQGLQDLSLRAAGARVLALVVERLRVSDPTLADACSSWRELVETGAFATSVDALLGTAEPAG